LVKQNNLKYHYNECTSQCDEEIKNTYIICI